MSEQLKTSVTAARAMQILADLARRTPLRMLGGVCEQQKQISTAKMAGYIEQAGDELAGYAFNLRQHNDALHAEAEALRLQNAMLVTAASNINSDREALRAENGRLITGLSHLAAVMAQHDETPEEINALALARDLMGATPAPEVPDHIAEASKMAEQGAVKVERDLMGTMHIKVGDFDAVQVRYQYPYTDNSSTKRLAERIADMLRNPLAEQGELQEAVHWRAVLDPSEVPMQLNPHEHVAGFTNRRAAEDWIAARLQMAGWHYTLEALYPGPQPSQANRIPAGLYAELEALRTLRDATSVYLQGYMRDEIEDEDNCVTVDQHDAACSVKSALDNARALEWKGGDK